MKVFKKDRFSIRKIKGVVGSVFLGSLLMASSVVDAATYHYVDKEVISQEAKDLIQTGKPDGDEVVYALVYQKDQLPQTGTEASVLTAFGLLTVGSLLLIYKRKKIASAFLVGAMGLVVLPSAGAVDPVATLAPASREGVVEMEGYRYVGYLSGDILKMLGLDTVLEEASAKPGEVTIVEVETPQSTTNQEQAKVQNQAVETEEAPKEEAPKTEESPKEEPKSEVAPTDETLPKVEEEKGVSAEPAPVEEVSGVVESKTDEQAPVKSESQPSDKPAEESKVVTPVEQPVQPTQPEQPTETKPVEQPSDQPTETKPLEQPAEQPVETKPVDQPVETPTETKPVDQPVGTPTVTKPVDQPVETPTVTKPVGQPVGTPTVTKPVEPPVNQPTETKPVETPVDQPTSHDHETPKEKSVPVLTLTSITDNAMNRSANLNYNLENADNAEIKNIVAEIKDGDKVVKTIDLSKEKLEDVVEGLNLYKDYKVATRMTYNRGQGDETTTLDEKPLRLDLKKVEIKNIKETSLMSVDDAGVETDKSLLTEKPTDVSPLYLRVTTHDNKTTRLAVSSVEEVVVDGKTLYKVVAKAPDLVQRRADDTLSEEYVHYFEKQKLKEGNVYYNFNELVKDMQANPTGEFKLGADLTAANVPTPNKQYVTNIFKGKLYSEGDKRYTIHNLARPLFNRVENAHIHDINFGNVNINMPWADKTAPLGDMFKNSTIENIKVTGNVVGNNDVTGMVNKLDESNMRNVAFIGNITGVGNKGWWSGGLVSESWRSNVDSSYVDANIKANNAKFGGLVAKVNHGGNPNDVKQKGRLTKSVVKGTMTLQTNNQSGGLIHENYDWGWVENNVSMMKVTNGEMMYGSGSVDSGDPYFGFDYFKNNVYVNDVASGNVSYNRSKQIKGVDQAEADKRIASFNITADKYEITQYLTDKLNHVAYKEDTYKTTQDYNAERELAYRNIEKLQPFYNKEWIINQGNKIPEGSKLLTTEVLSVTGMKYGQFVTDLSDVDHIMIHYADGTKEEKAVSPKAISNVEQVKEYGITDLGDVVYTPNMVVKDRTQLLSDIKAKLDTITLESPEVRAITGNVGALYLEESFAEVKGNLDKLVKALVENEDHQLNGDEAAIKALLKKVEDNKAKIMMALTYLNRYYGIEYGDLNIKNIMMFKPDFYGKTPSVIDRLIRIGSQEKNLKGDRTQDAYREIIAGDTGKGDLRSFLDYNMRLFTNDTDLNDWFIHSAKNVYVVEPETTNPDLKNKRHRVFDGLNNNMHARMILPLLNLKKAHIFMISTYNTMAYSSFEKYGKNTEAEREAFKERINYVAKAQQTYLDFWSRLALPNVRDRLLKSQNMVPTPVWDNQAYAGIKDANRRGYGTDGKVATPIRELFGPTDRWHQINWNMGAMAKVYAKPYEDEQVFFMVTNMLEDFGISAFTHETTHVNDRMAYLGGHGHRQGTDLEAYAQGMLQTPDKSTSNGEYGALGINMAYHRQNDGNQWYNPDPEKLQTREQIDHYMKNYNDALMMLDHLEADAVLPQLNGNTSRWFKKIDRQYRSGNSGHQFDKIRELTEDEKKVAINTIDDLITNNLMTKHGAPGDGTYNPTDFSSAYVNMNMMTGIYGGNTSQGAPGAASFKHNTFRMWGYFGYENGFVGYASSKYQGAANKENNKLLGDDFIIKKVSNGRFTNLEDWKKEYYKEVKAKGEKGFTAIEIDGKQITTYAELKVLFDKAVEADLAVGGTAKTVELKSKVFKALLKNTDGFTGNLFKA